MFQNMHMILYTHCTALHWMLHVVPKTQQITCVMVRLSTALAHWSSSDVESSSGYPGTPFTGEWDPISRPPSKGAPGHPIPEVAKRWEGGGLPHSSKKGIPVRPSTESQASPHPSEKGKGAFSDNP